MLQTNWSQDIFVKEASPLHKHSKILNQLWRWCVQCISVYWRGKRHLNPNFPKICYYQNTRPSRARLGGREAASCASWSWCFPHECFIIFLQNPPNQNVNFRKSNQEVHFKPIQTRLRTAKHSQMHPTGFVDCHLRTRHTGTNFAYRYEMPIWPIIYYG